MLMQQPISSSGGSPQQNVPCFLMDMSYIHSENVTANNAPPCRFYTEHGILVTYLTAPSKNLNTSLSVKMANMSKRPSSFDHNCYSALMGFAEAPSASVTPGAPPSLECMKSFLFPNGFLEYCSRMPPRSELERMAPCRLL